MLTSVTSPYTLFNKVVYAGRHSTMQVVHERKELARTAHIGFDRVSRERLGAALRVATSKSRKNPDSRIRTAFLLIGLIGLPDLRTGDRASQ